MSYQLLNCQNVLNIKFMHAVSVTTLFSQGLKRGDQNALLELYRNRAPAQSHGQGTTESRPQSKMRVQEQELSRIRRLEKIIKKKL